MKVHDGNKLKLVLLVVFAIVLAGVVVVYAVDPSFMQGMLRTGQICQGGDKGCLTGVYSKPASGYSTYTSPATVPNPYCYSKTALKPKLNFGVYSLVPLELNSINKSYDKFAMRAVVWNLGAALKAPSTVEFLVLTNWGDFVSPEVWPVTHTFQITKDLGCGEQIYFDLTIPEQINKADQGMGRIVYLDPNGKLGAEIAGNGYYYLYTRSRFYLNGTTNTFSIVQPTLYSSYAMVEKAKIYTGSLDASVANKFTGWQFDYSTRTPEIYTSSLYAHYINSEPAFANSNWTYAFLGYPNVNLNIFNGTQTKGTFVYFEDVNSATGRTINYSNLIYVPPRL